MADSVKGANANQSARAAALIVLNNIFIDGAYTNIALNKVLRTSNLSDLDRRFATELVYGTVKAKGTLDWIIEKFVEKNFAKLKPNVLNLLRMAVYQIVFLARIPDSAACNEAVNLAKKGNTQGVVKFINGILRNIIRQKETLEYPTFEEDKYLHLALSECHPLWLVKKFVKQFGYEGAEELCKFDNLPTQLCLRVNTLLVTREELIKQLSAEEFEVIKSLWCEDGIICEKIPSLQVLWDKFGKYVYVQDESSMLVGRVLNPQKDELVLDVCAAPGGKTTHLATLMENTGKVYACDIHPHKLDLIKENYKRLNLTNIEVAVNDATVLNENWLAKMDRVLVDAPCSGLGVLRRRAEARWRKEKKDLKIFPPLQTEILNTAAKYVKVGGFLLYSTCTIEQCENHYIVEEFLTNNKNFTLAGFKHPKTGEVVEELQLYPQIDGIDGFYLALLKREK